MKQVLSEKQLMAQADFAAALRELHEKTALQVVLEMFPGAKITKIQDAVLIEVVNKEDEKEK